MNKKFLSVLLIVSNISFAEVFKGIVESENDKYYLNNLNGSKLEIVLPSVYQYTLQTIVPDYLQEFEGELVDNKIMAKRISTTIGGLENRRGYLAKNSDGKYSLDGEEVVIREGKILNGHRFDQSSVDYFTKTEVEVEGSYIESENGSRIFQIKTIIPKNLFSADEDLITDDLQLAFNNSSSDFNFLLNEFPLNKYAQSSESFRKTIYKADSKVNVSSGDSALILTLSGRTGDAIGSSAGHFVAGEAKVREDLSLEGNIFNSYVPNKKEIFSSNTSLPYYYGHVVGGQNVHRPTYSLVIYGDKMENITQKIRDIVDLENPKLRVQKDTITPTYNCTTIAMKALKQVGLYGDHDRLVKKVFDVQNLALLNPMYYFMNHNKGAGALSMALATDPERYIPRNAFESYIKILKNKRYRKKLGIKRIDFIYFTQIPSSRPLGGIPYLGVGKALKAVSFVKQNRDFDDEIENFLNSLGQREVKAKKRIKIGPRHRR